MKFEAAKKFLPFIQAFAEGKEIQFREDGGCWKDINDPSFTSLELEYRIKPPKPICVYMNVYDASAHYGQGYASKEKAEQVAKKSGNSCIKTIKLMEVIDDE